MLESAFGAARAYPQQLPFVPLPVTRRFAGNRIVSRILRYLITDMEGGLGGDTMASGPECAPT